MKAYEEVLQIDKSQKVAVSYLKEMYQRCRYWEKLIDLVEYEVSQLPNKADRIAGLIALAEMADKRIRRPSKCIKYWAAVLEVDPDNEKAAAQWSAFHERTAASENLESVFGRLKKWFS